MFQTNENDDAVRDVNQGIVSVSRNAACPCGSYKKYKFCHAGIPLPDKDTEANLLKLAMEGDVDSQVKLADFWYYWSGLQSDAAYWYKEAAVQGDKYALIVCGLEEISLTSALIGDISREEKEYICDQIIDYNFEQLSVGQQIDLASFHKRLNRMDTAARLLEIGLAKIEELVQAGNAKDNMHTYIYHDALGTIYEEKNEYERALFWYRKAAEAEYHIALYHLACMFKYGRGVPQNDTEALALFKLAASKGNALSMKEIENHEG